MWAWLQQLYVAFMSKLALLPPRRTPPLTGQIGDIFFTPYADSAGGIPILPRNSVNSTVLGTLSALDAVGTVTWGVIAGTAGPVKLSLVTPNQVQFNALIATGGTLLANRRYTFVATAQDARGVNGSFQKNFDFGTYAIPADISLGELPGASGHVGTIAASAVAGTRIGVISIIPSDPFDPGHGLPIGEPLAMHGPFTYEVTSGSEFEVLTGEQVVLARSSSGSLSEGVVHPIIRVTDADGEYVEVTLDITVTAEAEAAPPGRFDPLDLPTPVIALVWNLAGNQPTTSPVTSVCKEGSVGTWKVYSTDCPLLHLNTYKTINDVRKAAVANGYTEYTFRFGTTGSPYDYDGPYCVQLSSLTIDNTGAVEYIGLTGTGNQDAGSGPSGVKLWDPPNLQIKQNGGANNDCLLDLHSVPGMSLGKSKYRLHNLRYGPTREEESAAVIKVFNVPGATTAAECILPKRIWHGQGLAIMESAKQVCATHCEVVGSFFQGMHATKKNRNQRYAGIVQAFDCLMRNNGDVGGEHNFYLGDTRFGVIGYNFLTAPSGHNVKFDNNQRAEIYENSISAYHLDYIKYLRYAGANAVKTFTGNTTVYVGTGATTYEAALRQIPDTAPYTIDIYSWVDDNGQSPNFTDAAGTANLGSVTVLTGGSPSNGNEAVRTVSGNPSTSEGSNTATATFEFHSSKHGQWVRIPGRGMAAFRADSAGGSISIDNSNQDFAVWNNIYHSYVQGSSTASFVYIQGRHQGGDLRHHKQPPYTYQDASYANEIDLSTVQGGVVIDSDQLPQSGPPKTFVAYVSSAGGPGVTAYKIMQADFIYSDMFGQTGAVSATQGGPLAANGTTVYDVEIRCDNGAVHSTTMTLTTLVKISSGGTCDFMVALASAPPSTITGNADHRNAVVFKKSASSGGSASWDRPIMNTADQRDWFDRTAPNYYLHLITFPEDRTEKNFSKQEPSISGERWGIPFGYVNNNLCVALPQPDLVTRSANKDACVVQSLNVCFSTSYASDDGSNYRVRMAFPPLNSSDGVAWPDQAYAGDFNFRLATRTSAQTGGPLFGTDGTGGVGINGSDMIRPNAVVMKENGIFDANILDPLHGGYSGVGNIGNNSADDTIFNTVSMYADIRFIPQNNTATVDANGCVKFTLADKTSFPSSYDRGRPISCIAPYHQSSGAACITANGAGPFDRCRIQTLSGGTPVVGDVVQFECDTQFGVGEGVHTATLTTVETVNATTFDIIFTPQLPQVGDTDSVGNAIALGHEKGLSVFTSINAKGGRGVFMKAARLPLPSWWLDPTDISDAA